MSQLLRPAFEGLLYWQCYVELIEKWMEFFRQFQRWLIMKSKVTYNEVKFWLDMRHFVCVYTYCQDLSTQRSVLRGDWEEFKNNTGIASKAAETDYKFEGPFHPDGRTEGNSPLFSASNCNTEYWIIGIHRVSPPRTSIFISRSQRRLIAIGGYGGEAQRQWDTGGIGPSTSRPQV